MSAHDQLALDEHGTAIAPRPREAGTASQRDASDEREGEHDRWRVSGLFVQPREINDEERDR